MGFLAVLRFATAKPYTVTQDKDNFSRAEIGLFLPLWFTFYDTFPVVSFFLLNVVLIYPKLSL